MIVESTDSFACFYPSCFRLQRVLLNSLSAHNIGKKTFDMVCLSATGALCHLGAYFGYLCHLCAEHANGHFGPARGEKEAGFRMIFSKVAHPLARCTHFLLFGTQMSKIDTYKSITTAKISEICDHFSCHWFLNIKHEISYIWS